MEIQTGRQVKTFRLLVIDKQQQWPLNCPSACPGSSEKQPHVRYLYPLLARVNVFGIFQCLLEATHMSGTVCARDMWSMMRLAMGDMRKLPNPEMGLVKLVISSILPVLPSRTA